MSSNQAKKLKKIRSKLESIIVRIQFVKYFQNSRQLIHYNKSEKIFSTNFFVFLLAHQRRTFFKKTTDEKPSEEKVESEAEAFEAGVSVWKNRF